MMRAQIGVQKSTGKIRGNWGVKKGVFGGVGGEGKNGGMGWSKENGVE